MFVASATERGVAVADLSDFRRIGTVALGAKPQSLLRTGGAISVICSDPALAVRVDPARLRIASKLRLPGRPITAVATSGGNIVVLASDPDCLIVADGDLTRIVGRIPLPGAGSAMDAWRDRAAVAMPSLGAIARISIDQLRVLGQTAAGTAGAPLRFRMDGNTLLAGDAAAKQIVTTDWKTGRLLARIPLAVEPRNFCFNADGGQMFVSGPGGDVVAIVAPYQNEAEETIPAGRAPAAMAVSPAQNVLLVCNPPTGDLTILDIDTRELAASVHIGDTPREVLVTPNGEYALVVSGGSGSVAVLRLSTVLNNGENGLTARIAKPLFTVFPMTNSPDAALILPWSA